MQKPDPKIIFFDIDDTLYIKDEKRIADSTRQALKTLKQKGIITAIATGRSPALIPLPIRNLITETGIDMLVSINGQFVRYQNKILAEFPMNKTDMEAAAALLDAEGIAYGFVSNEHFSVSRETQPLFDATGALGLSYQIDPLLYQRYPIYQMMAFYDENTGKHIESQLPERLKTVRWQPNGVDLLDKTGSKARGIQAALSKLGLTMADAMAFGDGLNDIEMLQTVGFGVAMSNAHPDLKAVADFVCPSVWEDGVYRGLQALNVLD
ncbi:MAG: Cof-type HAD-IIB family hydrolase [Neisseria sp.]|uniref:Cof-type HAD-IIB family hydrolase n=1 Tax=Neisseria sp. TaxID=192066 RepID=UPI0026DB81E2|nr:Cof-type HAD-IIB family hydrolase [Neisseria sp.]MDO4641361.1 Cof-type HAD-IIB family hydrolase [Neisseria sp.]